VLNYYKHLYEGCVDFDSTDDAMEESQRNEERMLDALAECGEEKTVDNIRAMKKLFARIRKETAKKGKKQ